VTRELRLKDLGRWYSGGTPPREADEDWRGDIPWISAKDIDGTTLREPTSFITRDAAIAHSRLVPSGALLIIVRGMALAHGLPVVQADREVAFNQDLRGLVVAPNAHPRFAYYALLGARRRLNRHIDRAAHGTARITDSIYYERLVLPDPEHQSLIAAFLDRECARIDELRFKAGELADGVIADVLKSLRGLVLDPGCALAPVKYYARTGTGHTPSRAHPEYWVPKECVVPWFTLADVNQIRAGRVWVVETTNERISDVGIANSSAEKHPSGTVLLSRTASVGFSAVMGTDMAGRRTS
jgi:type I restriction enzyme, S subunit